MELPKILIDHIRDGQIVLFLGSGASIGAIHKENNNPPTSSELSKLICDQFLGSEYYNRPLDQIAELAISETDLLTVQQYLSSIFNEFYPAEFHKMIPKFVWRSIATTNYDLIIERAYGSVEKKMQHPVVFKKNSERIEEKLKEPNNIYYFKLHGCITDINDPEIPLILTPNQYITAKKGRNRLFERLESLAYEYPFLFIGHSLGDSDIRSILLELDKLGEAKPRSYLIAPNIASAEKRYWESKRITCIKSSFKDFLAQLDRAIPEETRVLSTLYEKEDHPISKNFRVSSEIKTSQSLMTFLTRDTEYIHKGYKSHKIDPKAFYKGYFVDLSPIINNFDVRRSICDSMLSEIFLANEEDRAELEEFFLVKGHAGSGKSVLLNRICWEASVEYEKICLAMKQSAYPEYEPLMELYRLCKKRIYLFIDQVGDHKEVIEKFILRAREDRLPLTIIGTERHNVWNTECDDLKRYLTDSYTIRYLNEKEVIELINLLTRYKSLGHLEGLGFEKQKEALSKKAGRQLLVALHEATLGKPFTDIVFDEYNSIDSLQGKSLYLTVSILHRIGVPTRAGLISRVHGIPFSKFQDDLFSPLEYIVFAEKNDLINDYVYRTRHPHIADIVFERVLTDLNDRFDEHVRILNALDVSFNSDFEAFKGLTKARDLIKIYNDLELIREIYRVATERVEKNPILMQQEAIFEMNFSGGNLDRAEQLLLRAHKIAPYINAIAHSLSELSLKRAEGASTKLEAAKYRNESKSIASQLADSTNYNEHAYHTLLKIGLDELVELIDSEDSLAFDRKVRDIEKILGEALQATPDSSFILDVESRFSSLINKNPKALSSLKKAFKSNKKSTYLAVRLAKMHQDNNQNEDAIRVLQDCLDSNPNDKYTNFKLAMILMETEDSNPAEIKYHLRRSFTQGDNNYSAQFWYARCIYLDGEFKEAFQLFNLLRDSNLDTRIKQKPRGTVKKEGVPERFNGIISSLESSYAFITRDGINDRIFTHRSFNDKSIWEQLTYQSRVSFCLAFNYRGPLVLKLLPETMLT